MAHVRLWLGLVLLAVAFLAALAHHALRHFSRARLEEALEGQGRLRDLERLFAQHDALIRLSGVVHAAFLAAGAALAAAWAAAELGGDAVGTALGIVLTALVAALVAAAVPMAWARCGADGVLAWMLPLLILARAVLSPVDRVARLVEGLVRRLIGISPEAGTRSYIEEEIRSVVSEGEREGAIEEAQRDMIESVIQFREALVNEAMTPRTDIVSIEAAASPEEARGLVNRSGHSRIPVTDGNIDTVVGILYAKDLLRASIDEGDGTDVRSLMRKALFVPETKKLDELLGEFRFHKVHLAVVLDEYGGTAGLVTIEDIIEEIFGEIVDEYEDAPPQPIRRVDDRAFEVEARVHIDELNDELEIDLPEDEDYETIGGFVLSRLGSIPKAGEVLDAEGTRITVVEAEERRVTRLRIELRPKTPPEDED